MSRVVYLLRAFPEPSETFVRNEIRALRRIGVPVSVLSAWSSHPPAADWTVGDEGGDPVTILSDMAIRPVPSAPLARILARDLLGLGPRRALRAARLASLAEAAARALPRDAVLLHAHFANDAAVLARYVGAITGRPYRVTAHAYDLYGDPFLLDRNLRFAARILTVSEANRSVLESRLMAAGIAGKRVEVVRCGVELPVFDYRDPEPPRAPARILCVARLVPKKGHAVLLDALAALQRAGVAAVLDVAGSGPLESEIRARAEAPGLAGSVRFLGTLSHAAVRDAMRRSDVVALASRVAEDGDRDGLPVALVEAMALGVPVVATAVSGIPELIAPGTGACVPPDDPAALAAAIRDTLGAPDDVRIARTRAARSRVEADFDMRRIAERLRP
ncbi:MAG TPA: glycosyltransferase [Candidatus Polarisedimenticolaceae bacterium]|nr:glycosyltransferase [Candidatus Polarisedimenticolaceae bacterium]